MFNWLIDNVKGKHIEKKLELNNMEEYWEFMFSDFNNRLKLAILIGMISGFAMGVMMMLLVL